MPYAELVPGASIIADREDGKGPVAALRSAMSLVRTPTILVAPCDAPGLPTGLARRMVAYSEESKQAAVAKTSEGPIFALFAAPTDLVRERIATANRLEDLLEGAEPVETDAVGLNENVPRPTRLGS